MKNLGFLFLLLLFPLFIQAGASPSSVPSTEQQNHVLTDIQLSKKDQKKIQRTLIRLNKKSRNKSVSIGALGVIGSSSSILFLLLGIANPALFAVGGILLLTGIGFGFAARIMGKRNNNRREVMRGNWAVRIGLFLGVTIFAVLLLILLAKAVLGLLIIAWIFALLP